jgi:hypothetical protein
MSLWTSLLQRVNKCYGLEMSATTLTELEQLLEMENRDGKIAMHW